MHRAVFVFCDQFAHCRIYPDRQQRMQHAFSHAGKAMLTTSSTTFVSFLSNASSAFPAVGTFGLFAAALVLCNFVAVTTFWPAVCQVHETYISKYACDHPSMLCAICKSKKKEAQPAEKKSTELSEVAVEVKSEDNKHGDGHGGDEHESTIVRFFRETWAPIIIKMRYAIVILFVMILAAATAIFVSFLAPDKLAPNTIPAGNNYYEVNNVLLQNFVRTESPTAAQLFLASGIDRIDPIDRAGTEDTDSSFRGKPNYVGCDQFDPTPPAAQVWLLNLCHDVFFGNVTQYHGDTSTEDVYASQSVNGPFARRVLETGRIEPDMEGYNAMVTCPMQGFRDWLLTPDACLKLEEFGLDCHNTTKSRPNCVHWPADGVNSCEPFPVPTPAMAPLFVAMMTDERINAGAGGAQTTFDRFAEHVLVDEANSSTHREVAAPCRTIYPDSVPEGLVLRAMTTKVKLVQEIAQDYKEGIKMHKKWDAWHTQMLANAPAHMQAHMHATNIAWWFYYLNRTLMVETFSGIGVALILCFVILTLANCNPSARASVLVANQPRPTACSLMQSTHLSVCPRALRCTDV